MSRRARGDVQAVEAMRLFSMRLARRATRARHRATALAALALVIAAAAPARAYTNTSSGVVNLNGAVSLVCSVSLDGTGATTVFSDMTQGASGTLIGTVTEICNDANGYKVTVTSSNGGAFKGASTGTLIPYALTYDGSSVAFSGGMATLTPCGTRTTPVGLARPLAITFQRGYYASDGYSDTLTITMVGQ